jgi:hypothetical protein
MHIVSDADGTTLFSERATVRDPLTGKLIGRDVVEAWTGFSVGLAVLSVGCGTGVNRGSARTSTRFEEHCSIWTPRGAGLDRG